MKNYEIGIKELQKIEDYAAEHICCTACASPESHLMTTGWNTIINKAKIKTIIAIKPLIKIPEIISSKS